MISYIKYYLAESFLDHVKKEEIIKPKSVLIKIKLANH